LAVLKEGCLSCQFIFANVNIFAVYTTQIILFCSLL
jgi:hypothetical protein